MKRKRYSPELKARAAIEAIRGLKTAHEIARRGDGDRRRSVTGRSWRRGWDRAVVPNSWGAGSFGVSGDGRRSGS